MRLGEHPYFLTDSIAESLVSKDGRAHRWPAADTQFYFTSELQPALPVGIQRPQDRPSTLCPYLMIFCWRSGSSPFPRKSTSEVIAKKSLSGERDKESGSWLREAALP